MKDAEFLTGYRIVASARNGSMLGECEMEAVQLAIANKCDVEFGHNNKRYVVSFKSLLKQVVCQG